MTETLPIADDQPFLSPKAQVETHCLTTDFLEGDETANNYEDALSSAILKPSAAFAVGLRNIGNSCYFNAYVQARRCGLYPICSIA